MRKRSAANSAASSPPVPALISMMTFLSSRGSFGTRRTFIFSMEAVFFASRAASSSSAMAFRSASEPCASSVLDAISASIAM